MSAPVSRMGWMTLWGEPPITSASAPAAIEQAEPTSRWQLTSAPPMDAFSYSALPGPTRAKADAPDLLGIRDFLRRGRVGWRSRKTSTLRFKSGRRLQLHLHVRQALPERATSVALTRNRPLLT